MKKEDSNIPFTPKRIEKSPDLPNLVASQIIESISSGELKPGIKLPSELEMTQQFGISRLSLREAMKLLEAKGYIESMGRKGKFVKSIEDHPLESTIEGIISVDHDKIWELLFVRRLIDSEAAALAAKNASDSQIKKLREYLNKIKKFDPQNLMKEREVARLYDQFYKELADITNNTIFAHLMKSISSLLKGAFPFAWQNLMHVEETTEAVYNHHLKIISSIEKREAEAAKNAVIEHIDWLKKTLEGILK